MEEVAEVKSSRKAKVPKQSDLVVQPVTALSLPMRAANALGSVKAEAELLALVEKSKDITAVIDKDGREQAHRMAMNLQTARTSITKVGKLAREDATAFSKAVIAEEARLLVITDAEEKRVFKLRDDFDAIEKAAKEEAERIEREKLAAITDRIQEIRDIPYGMIGKPSADIAAARESLANLAITEELFGEVLLHAQANAAKADSVRALDTAHAAAVAAEEAAAAVAAQAEANRIAAAAMEAERLRMAEEQAAREAEIQKQAKALADQRAADEAKAQAEAAQTKKEQKEAAERIAAQQAQLDLRVHEQNEEDARRAEAARVAALPPPVVETVAEVETAAPQHVVHEIVNMSGMSVSFVSSDGADGGNVALKFSTPDTEPVNDLAEVEMFRIAAAVLLNTRTATEVINILSEVIAEQGE